MGGVIQIAQNFQPMLAFIISLTTVLGIFTGIINKIFNKRLKPIVDRLDKSDKENLEDKMQQWRFECVTFASNLRKGTKYSIYEFQAIFVFADKYEQAVERLEIKNNLFSEELSFIKKKYAELTEEK